MILSYTATEKDNGRTVYSIMRKELEISATLLRRIKKAGAIYVSGEPVFTNYKLTPGQRLTVDIGLAEQECDNQPEEGDVEVLFENEGLLAVNKQSGVLIHPSRSRYTGTLSNFVAGYLQERGAVQDMTSSHSLQPSCHAVNRLDRDTSGVVLFAKNSYMKALASEALSQQDALKEYNALVYGKMPEKGTVDAPICRLEEQNMLRVISPEGQRAVTHYETIRIIPVGELHFSLIKLVLETGRTHQIRVHCLHIGHPILGDKLYSSPMSLSLSERLGVVTQALHARRLSFTEPLSGKYTEITAPLPQVFKTVLEG